MPCASFSGHMARVHLLEKCIVDLEITGEKDLRK
jgi:hypothetical protein